MILQFDEEDFIDVEKISVLRWLPRKQVGMALVEGERVFIDRTSFNLVMKAYIYLHKTHMYGNNLKRIRWVRHKEETNAGNQQGNGIPDESSRVQKSHIITT